MRNNELKYWIWFSRLNEISNFKKQKLIEIYKFPEVLWNKNNTELKNLKYLNKNEIDVILDKTRRENLGKYVDYMKKNNINLITIFDEKYPHKLKNMYDKPLYLYTKGNEELLNCSSIAIVGSRKSSDYGENVTKNLAYNLAKNNICIVSGLAKGIDKCAHIGTLAGFGNTIAVLANGLDIVYPLENKALAEMIVERGGLIVSEYIIGTKPNKMFFPERNRIISGLSDGVIVVEASEKSGALITADFAIEQGKEVFAVPGNINSMNSTGTNNLIKEGASILTSYKDVLYSCYNINNI